MILTKGVGAPTPGEEASEDVNTGTGSRISVYTDRRELESPQSGPGLFPSTCWDSSPETKAAATPGFQFDHKGVGDWRSGNHSG